MKSEKFRDVVEAALMYAMGVEFKIWKKSNPKTAALFLLDQHPDRRTALYPDLTNYKNWDSADEIYEDIKDLIGIEHTHSKAQDVLEHLEKIMDEGYNLKVV